VKLHRVRVSPLPSWVDAGRLLGEGPWELTPFGGFFIATAELSAAAAADLDARLRGVVLAGQRLGCEIVPRLARPLVRKARLDEARRQRDRSVGLSREGVVLDDETRLGLTPEALALALGERAKHAIKARLGDAAPLTVVDVCCGAGGNTIGFARSGFQVTAVEQDAQRLAAARHNARLYGVGDRVVFVHADAREVLDSHAAALWFVDVPWGARSQTGHLPLLAEILSRRPAAQELWAKVPADFDPALVPGAQPIAWFGAGAGDAHRVKLVVLELLG